MKTRSQNPDLRDDKQYLIHAIICAPSPRAVRHCNCDVFFVMSDIQHPEVFGCILRRWILGGWNEPAHTLGITFLLERHDFFEYWCRKFEDKKQAELMDINKVRQQMRDFASACFGEGCVVFAQDCLYRFTGVKTVDPWCADLGVWGRKDSADFSCPLFEFGNHFDSSHADHMYGMTRQEWKRHKGKLYQIQLWHKLRAQIASWHVLPIRYVQHDKRTTGLLGPAHRMTPCVDVIGPTRFVKQPEQWVNYIRKLVEIRRPLVRKNEANSTLINAVHRAMRRGNLSTKAARAWFKKHQILNRLNDGIKARKTQQPIEEIAA
jgi:hypothetical protein